VDFNLLNKLMAGGETYVVRLLARSLQGRTRSRECPKAKSPRPIYVSLSVFRILPSSKLSSMGGFPYFQGSLSRLLGFNVWTMTGVHAFTGNPRCLHDTALLSAR
jgi:hypothetical protein